MSEIKFFLLIFLFFLHLFVTFYYCDSSASPLQNKLKKITKTTLVIMLTGKGIYSHTHSCGIGHMVKFKVDWEFMHSYTRDKNLLKTSSIVLLLGIPQARANDPSSCPKERYCLGNRLLGLEHKILNFNHLAQLGQVKFCNSDYAFFLFIYVTNSFF